MSNNTVASAAKAFEKGVPNFNVFRRVTRIEGCSLIANNAAEARELAELDQAEWMEVFPGADESVEITGVVEITEL